MVEQSDINSIRITSDRESRELSLSQIPRLPPESITLDTVIGQGGFGCIYKGSLRGMPVAIKQIMAPKFQASEVMKMVENELKLLTRLRHSNFVCQVIGYYHADPTLSIIMTLAENGDLQRFLRSGHLKGDWNTKACICRDIAKAVDSVHAENIIHGDLKAANILLDRLLTPKVIKGSRIRILTKSN